MVINGIDTTDRKAVNAHYGKLNERFEERASVLRAFGFTYEKCADYDMAVFVYKRFGFKKPVAIAASFVLCADDLVWAEKLNDYQS